ncbi:MAG: CpaF family protein, partial [Pseudomonadota bacterium]
FVPQNVNNISNKEIQVSDNQALVKQSSVTTSNIANMLPPEITNKFESGKTELISFIDSKLLTSDFILAKEMLVENTLEQVNFVALEKIHKDTRKARVGEMVDTLISKITIPLTSAQTALLKDDLLNEILGLGPLELLMNDPDVSDIMINTHKQVYIEKSGKILLSDIVFTSERHLLNTIQKIVAPVGRRVDETSPMVDARMHDGSRFNAIIPPLALDGALVSIRKFKKNKIPLSKYIEYGSMTQEMSHFLEICGRIRLNIMISGGTGSGKTTLLNALSGHIDIGERVITIEDAAELMLHQPHVLRLETRPQNTEGTGEITQRQLVRNALRMRPDRIILGEIRGDEVIDVLAAMNTGHDGSMATIHSNNPRDCLSRIENLVAMSGVTIPTQAMRQQIASAVNLIVQISRMRDGARRITHIEEVLGMERDTIVTQTLFGYQPGGMDSNGRLTGRFYCAGIKPRFIDKAQYFNLDNEIMDCIKMK